MGLTRKNEIDEFIKQLCYAHEDSEIKTLMLQLNNYLITNYELLVNVHEGKVSLEKLLDGLNSALAQEYKSTLLNKWGDSLGKKGFNISSDFKISDKNAIILIEVHPKEEYLQLIFKSRLGLEYQGIDMFYLSLRNSIWKQLRVSLSTMNKIVNSLKLYRN